MKSMFSAGDRVVFTPPRGTIGKLPLDAQKRLQVGAVYVVKSVTGNRISLVGYEDLLSKTIHDSCFKIAEKDNKTDEYL
jgi:hypothetical protein